MIAKLKNEIASWSQVSIYSPSYNLLTDKEWEIIIDIFLTDYRRYYESDFDPTLIKYYPGLLATFMYRIARQFYLNGNPKEAQTVSSLSTFLTSMEIYYSSSIGSSLKINHGIGTIIGARTHIGNNVLLHHNITLGDRFGGRPTIGDNVIIYPGAVIIGDITVGNGAIVGANSTVLSSVPTNLRVKGLYKI